MKKNVVAIIQARMGSSRLPGKMLLPLSNGRGALEIMLDRLRQAKTVSRLVVATTDSPMDDVLAELCHKESTTCFRGSRDDVLTRYYHAALDCGCPDVIVRLTGDCPLHDPKVVDHVVSAFLDADVDYLSNVHPPTYPDGLDTEVFTLKALERAWKDATLQSDREHVTPFIWRQPQLFRHANIEYGEDLSSLRWTLDEPQDAEFLRLCFAALGGRLFSMEDVLMLLRDKPELLSVNAAFVRNEGYEKSLAEDARCSITH